MTTNTTTIEAGDEITTLDEANEAIQNNLVIRVQPPAPGATKWYVPSGGEWYRGQTLAGSGKSSVVQVDIDGVRKTVKAKGSSDMASVTARTFEDSPFGE